MKYKDLFLAAGVLMTLAGCSDNFSDTPPVVTPPAPEPVAQETPILFGLSSSGSTRAEFTGAEAAKMLGKQFVVSGYKGSSTATAGNIVFDNYVVKYNENTAHTTESNTSNWEYVGQDRIKHAIDHGITRQAIKYWDYNQPQYDFIAWSTGSKTAVYEGTPAAGQVLVSAITPNSATGANGTAFTFTGKAKDLNECYIADLVTVKKTQYGDDPVTIKFRSLGSKVRIGIYETVPGYSVKDVKFYTAADVALAGDETDKTPRIFTTAANDIYTEGTYTVYYPTVDKQSSDPTAANYSADNNVAHVKFAGTGTQSSVVEFGNLNYTIAEEGEKTAGAVFLGRSSNTASFAGEAEGNYYTQYLPNESGTNLNLRVNYTLESIDGSGETIEVKGATAQVPLIYTQWKPGTAYTYLFKISDKTNGHTGVYDPTKPDDTTVNSDPAGLYPITFDAVVVNTEEDASQETITLVSTPSITTYQKGSKVVDNNEYLAATGDIFVTVNDGTTASTPDLANGALQTLTGKAALYKLSSNRSYTEADVIDALQIQEDNPATAGTTQGRNGIVLTPATLTLTDKVEYGVDGNPISVGPDKAAKFTPEAGTYAFVYTKKNPEPANDKPMFEPVPNPQTEDIANYWRYAYTDPTGDVQKGVVYIKPDDGTDPRVFLGQGVNNLYLQENTGTTESPAYNYIPASGYAVTGTDYYYTLDNGMNYKKAVNIAYAGFESASLYTFNGGTYTLKADTKPVDGTAYYQKQDDDSYTYCVILPQQANGLKSLNYNEKSQCQSSEVVVPLQTYFDKYTKNDGVYYVKIIKVQ